MTFKSHCQNWIDMKKKNRLNICLLILVGLIAVFTTSCRKEDSTTDGNMVKDIDGNVYHTVTIGTQVWMAENLKVTRYRNGDKIGTTSPATLDISGEAKPQYQWAYDGKESNVATYGRLYTWYAITDIRNVCPVGWHIPTLDEWTTLGNYLMANGYNYDGTKADNKYAKSMAASSGWGSETTPGAVGNSDYSAKRNATGFSAMPGGIHSSSGTFEGMTWGGVWWSTTSSASWPVASIVEINFHQCDVNMQHEGLKNYGFSVRCLRD